MNFDTEKFIAEIENRPVIWDLTSERYMDRDFKKQNWEELARLFGGDDLSPEKEKDLCINLQKRWKSLRDCYVRELRRLKNTKKAGEKRKNPYIYYKQLLFLQSTTTIDNELEGTSNEEGAQIPPLPPRVEGPYSNEKVVKSDKSSKRTCDSVSTTISQPYINERLLKSRKTCDSVETELINVLNKSILSREERDRLESDEDRMFLLSLLSDLKQVPEHLKLTTRMDIISVIEKAKCNTFYSSGAYSSTRRAESRSENSSVNCNDYINCSTDFENPIKEEPDENGIVEF